MVSLPSAQRHSRLYVQSNYSLPLSRNLIFSEEGSISHQETTRITDTLVWSSNTTIIFFSSHDQGQHFFWTHPTYFSNFTLRLDTQTKRRKGIRCPPSQPPTGKKNQTDAIQEQRLPHIAPINPLKEADRGRFYTLLAHRGSCHCQLSTL